MALPAQFLKAVRLTHLYLGVFVAPSLLFFAITGALQTFSLHETTRGSSYQPPRILVELAQIHKKQTLQVPIRKPAADSPGKPAGGKPTTDSPVDSPAAKQDGSGPAREKGASHELASETKHNPLPLKVFFLFVSVALCLSTLTGIYMAYKYNRSEALVTALLFLGIAVPVILLTV